VAAGVLVTAADAFVLLLVEQWGVRQLEAVFGMFIAIMACSFGVMYNNADIPQGQVLEGQPRVFLKSCTSRTLIPHFPPAPLNRGKIVRVSILALSCFLTCEHLRA